MSQASRIEYLDGLRGLAALSVVIFHYNQAQINGVSALALLSFGVHLFFIISGYVIFFTAEKKPEPKRFLMNRFIRLYPTFFVSVLVTTVLALSANNLPVSLGQSLTNFLFFHRFLGVPHLDSVYWTLLMEVIFYLYVFLALQFRALKPKIIFFLIIVHGLLAIGNNLIDFSFPKIVELLLLLDFGVFFALGILFYFTHQKLLSVPYLLFGFGVLFSVMLTQQGVVKNYGQFSIAFIDYPVAALGVTGVAALFFFTPFRQLLNNRIMKFLGYISYPLYLLHNQAGASLSKIVSVPLEETFLHITIYSVLVLALSSSVTWLVDDKLVTLLKVKITNKGKAL